MDFLLRYPNMLVRALNVIGESKKSARAAAAAIPEEDRDTIEARMIRFQVEPVGYKIPPLVKYSCRKAIGHCLSRRADGKNSTH